MQTTDIKFDEVNIKINDTEIQKLGEEHGISMFIIYTYEKVEKYIGIDFSTGEDKIENCDLFEISTLKIDKAMNKWVATIDGHFAYNFRKKTIVGICKLNFV